MIISSSSSHNHMDDTHTLTNNQNHSSVVSGNKGGGSAKLLRYPLRSGTKSKDEKLPVLVSASRRVRPSSSVTQSVSVLDLSSKEKSAKPLRRLSIPTKPTAKPTPQPAKSVTPVSDKQANKSMSIEGKSDTLGSDVCRTLIRKKFSVLSSASYWLSHIKLSEAAGRHHLSIGFFKLAQEAACENPQLLRDELKSYALRHNIIDLGETAQEVLQSYELSENIVQGSQSSCVSGIDKPKPKTSSNRAGSVTKGQKKLVSKTKASANSKLANQHSSLEAGSRNIQKNFQKPIKKEVNKEKQMVKSKGKKPVTEDAVSSTKEPVTEENKENMDACEVEEISLET